jgi:uncharacterized LabA/DUF88 family protein
MTVNSVAGVVKLVLLIDGDNVSATFMPLIMREASAIGTVAVRRIYGQFKSGKMKSWLKHVGEFDLMPVNVTPLTKGKNATDMKLVIEAMDMLYGRQLDGVCIASSDGDFTPLAERIRINAVAVYGFGAKKAPAGYKDAFDRFYECDTLLAAEKKNTPRRASTPTPDKPTPLRESSAPKAAPVARAPRRGRQPAAPKPPLPTAAILTAIEAVRESDGWSHLGSVSNQLRRAIKDFAPKNHGHSTLKRLIASMPEVESHTTPSGAAFVRRRTT